MNFKSKKTIKKMWFLKKKKNGVIGFCKLTLHTVYMRVCVCVCVLKTDEPDEKESVLNVMIRRVRLKCYCFLEKGSPRNLHVIICY